MRETKHSRKQKQPQFFKNRLRPATLLLREQSNNQQSILKSILQIGFSSPTPFGRGRTYANDGYLNPPPQRITLFFLEISVERVMKCREEKPHI
ncbi:hypothetical protein CEXT_390251 [Caerostris extrusa]|uniref:Uncharacterized protein n=1 Tax=Caerostris extrusa TaxID=172846 RepID=A0AAV4QFH1_CAEEX|nr:hypothetical protein CEXT_390251 [Caerostris extrusa]